MSSPSVSASLTVNASLSALLLTPATNGSGASGRRFAREEEEAPAEDLARFGGMQTPPTPTSFFWVC
jgi:hypothetical protein